MKKEFSYILQVILVFLAIFCIEMIVLDIDIIKNRTYNANLFYLKYLIYNIGYTVVGFIIGGNNLIKQSKHNGFWIINKKRIILVFIPTLFIANLNINPFIPSVSLDYIYENMHLLISFCIMSGYILSACFSKTYIDDKTNKITFD